MKSKQMEYTLQSKESQETGKEGYKEQHGEA